MIVFKILDTKDMMSHLLLKETFDNWFLVEAQVTTFARLGIAGRRNRNWYDQENDQNRSDRLGRNATVLVSIYSWEKITGSIYIFFKIVRNGSKKLDKRRRSVSKAS